MSVYPAEFWDARYAEAEYAYGEQPNAFFAAQLGTPPEPGRSRLLLPAEGEGRNGVHAARAGWRVQAFDISDAGRRKALALAARHGVTLDYQVTSFADARLDAQGYAAIALIFAHMHTRERQANHRRLASALAPGGRLLLEAYSQAQLGRGTGGPRDEAMLYTLDQLREDFEQLELLSLEQLEVEVVEGRYHTGMASVLRLVARRPMDA